MHHLRPLPYFSLTELERRKLLNNCDDAGQGDTKRTETSSFEFTKTNLEKNISNYLLHLYPVKKTF